MAVSLSDVARDLYGLAPADFTAARNARARELKPADAALAAQVGALRKPSPAAWVVNLLARERTDGLDALLRLGEQMRHAQQQLHRDELRRLAAARRDAVAGLAREGAHRAGAHGHPPSASVVGEVEQTLLAATSDPDAAAAVASGLLLRALRSLGFEPVDLRQAVAVPGAVPGTVPGAPAGAPPARPAVGAAAPVQLHEVRRRKEARREAERLEGDAEAAVAELDALDRRAHRLEVRRESLEAEAAEVREQLRTTESALEAADHDLRALADERARAQTEADALSRRAREARAAADALEPAD